jgi:hypothetical protein
MNEDRKPKFDLRKRQEYAFSASVENAKLANEAIKSSQNWLLVLGLAEMSFLGTLLLRDGSVYVCGIKALIIILLLAFVTFITGSVMQYKHMLKSARTFERISNLAITKYLNKRIKVADKIPEELELPEKQIISSDTANYFLFSAYLLIMVATFGIIFLIIIL